MPQNNGDIKILVTGGCGFIGHHIVEGLLKETKWQVVVLDALTYAGNLKRLTDISVWEKEKQRVKFVWWDLKSPISQAVHQDVGKLDYIWHLAAESSVDKSLENSIPFVLSNVLGTANLLEYVKRCQSYLKQFVYFSTDEVTGPAEQGEFHKEDCQTRPSNPYAASKAGGEALAYASAHAFKLPVIITRTMNVYGERQHPEKFIPKTLKSILDNKPVILHGTGNKMSSRCWIHARNICSALLFLADKGKSEEIYNVVGEERSVFEIADRIFQIIKGKNITEKDYKTIDAHSQRPGHDLRYALSGEKLKNMGWQPKLTFDQSFDKMVKWMVKNPQWLN